MRRYSITPRPWTAFVVVPSAALKEAYSCAEAIVRERSPVGAKDWKDTPRAAPGWRKDRGRRTSGRQGAAEVMRRIATSTVAASLRDRNLAASQDVIAIE